MKPLSEMTHYEVLEIQSEAGPAEVERAYRMAQSTWSEDSLAAYSVYEEGELAAIRERIELAYRVLSDSDTKREYDAELEPAAEDDLPVELSFDLDEPAGGEAPAPEVAPEIEAFVGLEEGGEGPWDGARLRRARLARGIDLDKIAQATKINPTYLQFIEEEQFADLPATVYVRGFVAAYARCVGIDPEPVAREYVDRLVSARPEPKPRRLTRRRR